MFVRENNIVVVRLYVILDLIYLITCQELHLIKPKLGICFDTYMENEPIYLSKINKACITQLPKYNNCLGIETKNGETIILECKGQKSKLDKGCYKIINMNATQAVVCQKLMRRRGCEIILTPSFLNIEMYCYSLLAGNAGIIVVRDNKPRRE